MKKWNLFLIIALVLGMAFSATQAFAASVDSGAFLKPPVPGNPNKPEDRGKPENSGDPDQDGEKGVKPDKENKSSHGNKPDKPPKTEKVKCINVRGVLAAPEPAGETNGYPVPGNELAILTKSGDSIPLVIDSSTSIHVPTMSKTSPDFVFTAGSQVTARLCPDGEGGWTAKSVHLIPGKPVKLHRVGIVTAFTDATSTGNGSITIEAKGLPEQSTTFIITGETKFLPNGTKPVVGSMVTVISPRDVTLGALVDTTLLENQPTAAGIVVHNSAVEDSPDD